MTKKELFYEKINPYVNAGFLKEIASSDNVTIYNFCNRCYLAAHYDFIGKYNDIPTGVIIDKSFVQDVLADDGNLITMLTSLSEEARRKIMIEFSPKTREHLINLLKRSEKEGPSKFIDLQFEEELMSKNKSL